VRTPIPISSKPKLGDDAAPIATQVMSSRSFGKRVECLQELREAISYHAANAAKAARLCQLDFSRDSFGRLKSTSNRKFFSSPVISEKRPFSG
jgi:DNA polymerase V